MSKNVNNDVTMNPPIYNVENVKSSKSFTPLSPNGDQNQFSPNNIHTLSRDNVMRIYEMIT